MLNLAGRNKLVKPGSIQSLIILPFDNFTGADSLDYFVSGMHSSLITDMQQISALRVIGKTTANSFKGTDLSLTQIASKLKVDAAVEGAISFFGKDSVCVQIGVIRSKGEEKQLWVEDFRVAKDQILNFYNDVTKQISEEINVVLTPQEEDMLAENRTVNAEAYDAYLKGNYYWDDGSEESMQKALKYMNTAIEKNPDWALLYSARAQIWMALAQNGFESPEITGPKIYEDIDKALELDPDLADAHYVNALMAYLAEWDWVKAEKEFLKALAINPGDVMARIFYGQLLSILQRPDEALAQGKLALEMDPLNPMIPVFYTAILLGVNDCETALSYLEKVKVNDPENVFANYGIELAAFRCGDYDKAFEAVKYILPLEDTVLKDIDSIFNEQGFEMAYKEILRQMEILSQNGYVVPVEMAYRYIMVNQQDKAMDWIEKGYEIRDPNMPYIATGIYLCEPLFNNPRFIDIVEKMNLPLKRND